MSYVQTVLNAVTLPAIPDMKTGHQRGEAEAQHPGRNSSVASIIGTRHVVVVTVAFRRQGETGAVPSR